MMNGAPYPELDELLIEMGEAGKRLSEIDAVEGAAGNISVYAGWPMNPRSRFPKEETIPLPVTVPELAGKTFLISGSGCRLREIIDQPEANVACLIVDEGGSTGRLFSASQRCFARVTSEFNTHLAVHADQARSGSSFHAIVHAQPPHLTYLSHVPSYQDTYRINMALLRWQPETIVNFPEGIGYIPFEVPGSAALMQATIAGLRKHRLVVWAKHGVMSRSDTSVKRAADLVEYAEAAARYEMLHRSTGAPGNAGLTLDEIRAICAAFGLDPAVLEPKS